VTLISENVLLIYIIIHFVGVTVTSIPLPEYVILLVGNWPVRTAYLLLIISWKTANRDTETYNEL